MHKFFKQFKTKNMHEHRLQTTAACAASFVAGMAGFGLSHHYNLGKVSSTLVASLISGIPMALAKHNLQDSSTTHEMSMPECLAKHALVSCVAPAFMYGLIYTTSKMMNISLSERSYEALISISHTIAMQSTWLASIITADKNSPDKQPILFVF